MNDRVSDNDRNVVSNAMIGPYNAELKSELNAFLSGELAGIFYAIAVKQKMYINVDVSAMYQPTLHFRFYDDAGYASFKKILSKYPKLEAVYSDGIQTLYGTSLDASRTYTHSVFLALRIYNSKIADDDEKWNKFCKSEHVNYMLLLSDYLINDVRFSESLNKRLNDAPDSDKLLAMINMN